MVRVHFGPPLLQKEWIGYGGLAQLGERLPCKQEVSGSIPLISTTSFKRLTEVPTEVETSLSFLGTQVPFKAQRSGFDWKRRNKDTVEHLMRASNAQVVDLISTICTLKTEH